MKGKEERRKLEGNGWGKEREGRAGLCGIVGRVVGEKGRRRNMGKWEGLGREIEE